jgi:endoglucanase
MSKMMSAVGMKFSVAVVAAGAVFAAGCAVNPKDPNLANTAEGKICAAPEGLIDDGEDSNNATAFVSGRGGYWYTFVDDAGSTVWPTAGAQGGTFEMSPGGAEGTKFAAMFKGKIGAGAVLFSGMGMNFLDPKGPYDASQYGGISFWAKKGANSTGNVRLKIPDNNTDPDGGVCSECFNDFGIDLKLSTEWQRFIVPWKAMKQMKGWGRPRKVAIDNASVYGIQFQVNEAGADYEIYVDEIRFTGCP